VTPQYDDALRRVGAGPRAATSPAVARVCIATLRAIENAIAPGLTADERELRCVPLRGTLADLIDAARWNGETL